tara:strand:+ start:23 stop:1222 length:1200 start_codon:yes stop_codon:yes gene_type:complete
LKTIAIFTGSRAEFGLQLPLLEKLKNDKNFIVYLLVGASHLNKDFGKTISEIEESGFSSNYLIDFNHGTDTLSSNPKTISIGIDLISNELKKINPDYFIVYGDRYETFASVIASTQMGIPTIHVEGGDITEGGTFDDSVRHAITKLSHIHLATNEHSKKRIIQMGEEAKRVFNVGLPAIDFIKNQDFTEPAEIIERYNLKKIENIIIFTQHPIPINVKDIESDFSEIEDAFKEINNDNLKIICTYPNSDIGGKEIIKILKEWNLKFKNLEVYKSLGRRDLHGLLNLNNTKYRKKVVFIGNSSSAIKEAPALNCPSLILGNRQKGRLHAESVYFTNISSKNIVDSVNNIFEGFDSNLYENTNNFYGEGLMAEKTLEILNALPNRQELLLKKFNEIKNFNI